MLDMIEEKIPQSASNAFCGFGGKPAADVGK